MSTRDEKEREKGFDDESSGASSRGGGDLSGKGPTPMPPEKRVGDEETKKPGAGDKPTGQG